MPPVRYEVSFWFYGSVSLELIPLHVDRCLMNGILWPLYGCKKENLHEDKNLYVGCMMQCFRLYEYAKEKMHRQAKQ